MASEQDQTEKYIRAALTAARGISARELSFTDDGIVATDPLGIKHVFTTDARRPSTADIMATLPNHARGMYFQSSKHVQFPGLGSWNLKADNLPVIRPEKQRHAALEALFDADPDDLARLRSLYGFPDTDIFVFSEGETRARDVAIGFATELGLTGHDVKLHIPPERDDFGYGRDLSQYEGDDIFVPAIARTAQTWDVAFRKAEHGYVGSQRNDQFKQFKLSATPHRSRIVVWEDRGTAYRLRNADKGAFNIPDRLQVIIGIEIVKSRPVAKIIFSDKAEAVYTTDEKIKNAPWTRHNERKAARLKSRPPAPKTWHQTTQDVADAFIARKAPRGFVSGKAMYFHGPVAYSLYDRNPVAAIVDLPDGRTLLFNGRDNGQGGTLAATVTSAMGDIDRSARDTSLLRFDIGNLMDLITIGDMPLDQFAWRAGASKSERDYPGTCTVNLEKLASYIASRREDALTELDEAFANSKPTYRKAGAYSFLAGVARFRDAMSELFGRDFPDAGDAVEYASLATSMNDKARARQLAIGSKRNEEPENQAPAEPFFQIRPA